MRANKGFWGIMLSFKDEAAALEISGEILILQIRTGLIAPMLILHSFHV